MTKKTKEEIIHNMVAASKGCTDLLYDLDDLIKSLSKMRGKIDRQTSRLESAIDAADESEADI